MFLREENELFDQIVSLENLFEAWKKFCRGKRSKIDVMEFEYHLEDNLFAIRQSLVEESYCHDPYQPFTILDPKQRNIHKATVRDRVVHQVVVNSIEPLFERQFIYDSYSCRVNKGTHAAVKRLRVLLQQETANHTKLIYALKCDVRKFFASVDHEILISLLERRIKDRKVIRLLRGIISSFSMPAGKGLPLGNLTSQLFANVYLHELDHYVKQDLRVRSYLRYCDDFVILMPSRSAALDLAERINVFLVGRLQLQLHPNKVTVRTWKQGIDFVGYILLPHATILRTKTVKRILRCTTLENFPSYSGFCEHANAHEINQILQIKAFSTPQ